MTPACCKDAVKADRRRIKEAVEKAFPDKAKEILVVIFPLATPPAVKKEWTDMSKEES